MHTTPTLAAPDAFGNQGARSSLLLVPRGNLNSAKQCHPGQLVLSASDQIMRLGVMRKLHSKRMSKPTLSKAALRTQLEAALANCHGPVTLCPPAPPPEADRGKELDPFIDEDEVAVTGR